MTNRVKRQILACASLAGYGVTLLLSVYVCGLVYDLIQHFVSHRKLPTPVEISLGMLAWATVVLSLWLFSLLDRRISMRLWGPQIRRSERIQAASFERLKAMTPEERYEEWKRVQDAEFSLPNILARARRSKGSELTTEEERAFVELQGRLSETELTIKQLRIVREAQLEAERDGATPRDE